MRKNIIGKTIALIIAFGFSITASADDFWTKLQNERVVSDSTVMWEQLGPGNAGFANLLRYHPTIPGKVAFCPDMWCVYQSDDNGELWYGITDHDGEGDFFHLRDLYFSLSDAEFGLAIGSSRLFETADTGRTWNLVINCPWYVKDSDGDDQQAWKKKVASLAIDPNNKNTWFVGGGSNVRGQDWLSCYNTATSANPHGSTADYEGNLWRTINGGTSWQEVSTGLDVRAQVGRIIVNPKNSLQVFASSNYGLYRSENGGTSWTKIGVGQLDNNIIMDMDFYYNEASGKFILYLIDQVQYLADGTTTKCTGGIFHSEDNGDTWTKMNGDLGLDINRLSGNTPNNYYKYIAAWLGITEAVAKTTYPDLPSAALQYFNMISADPSREGALYIGFADPQVANSIVPGRLWTTTNNGEKWINTARLYEHVWENDSLYWKERGNPWHENMVVGHESPHMQSGNNYALRSMRGLDVGVDGSVMIISDHSTMLSTDNGASWQQMDEDYTEGGSIIGHGNSNLPALTIGQDKRSDHMVLGSGEHRVWIPTDDNPGGRHPLKFVESAQETVISLAFNPYDSETVYATSSRQADKQYIYRSTDAGYNWSSYGVATPATDKWLDDFYTNGLCIDPIDNRYFYHGITDIVDTEKANMGGFYVSSDYGKTFQQSNNGLPNPVRIRDIEFDPRDNTRASLFAAAEKMAFSYYSPLATGGLYHSSDRGANWTAVNTPSSIQTVNYIAIDHTNRMYITTGYRGGGNGVWYTDDFGTTWHQIFKYAGAECIDVSPFDHNLLVVTASYLGKNPGVYMSRDRGLTWSKANIGLVTPQQIEDIEFNIQEPSEVWAALKGTGFYKGRIKNGDDIQVVKVSPASIDYRIGTDKQLSALIVNEEYNDQTIVWKTDNPAVVEVDENGMISPNGRGNAKVWATTQDGRFSDYAVVVVHQLPVDSIKINESVLKLKRNELFQLEVQSYPEAAGSISVKWESGDISVAYVTSTGRIQARKDGETYVVAYNDDLGLSDTCIVKVGDFSAVSKTSLRDIYIKPMPVKNHFSVVGVEEDTSITIFDISGKEVLSTSIAGDIDISDVKTGAYLVKVKSKNQEVLLKLIKR